ncbi:MAG: DUF1824 domain-containing protein [Phormidesmis priestleyi]|uniref:DUF1824 domain-containing protein n=1 Tax=Phormidesmis priestleyi TaxID=268141 RepID=A0A2W4X844_9CYAN|nr:MAG: DUF1824 domain-containing protein [Phormidesmis priestleyi]
MTKLSNNLSDDSFNELSSQAIAEQIKAIRQQLIEFSQVHVPAKLSAEQAQAVRAALLWLNEQSEYQTLGICADSLADAERALEGYVAALSEPVQVDIAPQEGAVFLKFNTLKNAWYLDGYSGDSRGVLVTYHTSEPGLDAVNGTYGPFSLDLFDGNLE